MREPTIARNYAEVLVSLARKANDLEGWGRMLHDVAVAARKGGALHQFLETPRISADDKNAVLGRAFQDRMPRLFVKFLQTLVKNRRQMMIPAIAEEYSALVDTEVGRVHAHVTVSAEMDAAGQALIAKELSRALGKTVVPHLTVDPSILGGLVVRVGDTVMDGSVRRRLAALRSRMMTGQPAA